jgi:hypothetical protein
MRCALQERICQQGKFAKDDKDEPILALAIHLRIKIAVIKDDCVRACQAEGVLVTIQMVF